MPNQDYKKWYIKGYVRSILKIFTNGNTLPLEIIDHVLVKIL